MVVLVLLFTGAGVAKLLDPASFKDQFVRFGLPEWWIPVTAAVELLGAALIALFNGVPPRLGAALLAATMAVATGLHLLNDPAALALPAFALMLLAAYAAAGPRTEPAPRDLADV